MMHERPRATPQRRCVCGADLSAGEWVYVGGRAHKWALRCPNVNCWGDSGVHPVPAFLSRRARVWHVYDGPRSV